MKKIIIFIACFFLVAVNVFADPTNNGRQPRVWDQAVSSVKLQSGGTDYTDNTTVLTNLALTGNNATGNAPYITMTATDGAGNVIDYYLWMDTGDAGQGTKGILMSASFPALIKYASFPYGDWRSSTGFLINTPVPDQ